MAKILILGTGNAQKDLIDYCMINGHEVYACSNKVTRHSKVLGENFIQIDIKDEERITEFAKSKGIEYIYSIGSDIAMPTIAKVSERLELNSFIDFKTAKICHSKLKTRQSISQKFNVKYLKVKGLYDLSQWNEFPCIIKPIDSQGQRGVYKAKNSDELRKYYHKALEYSIDKTVIVEQFIEGDEISVNAYLVDGKIVYSVISDRISFNQYPGGIIKEHIFPSKYERESIVKDKIMNLVECCTKEVGIYNGPAYFQIKINKDKAPKLIEMTPRLDGCHLWRIIKAVYGIDLLDMTIKHLINVSCGYEKISAKVDIPVNTLKYKLSFLTQESGSLMTEYDLKISDEVKYFEYYYEKGDIIQPINGYMEKVGYYILLDRMII